jgi:DNA-binding SARP family transcriptional activator/tetratricopeptide (TPR) repeat protein
MQPTMVRFAVLGTVRAWRGDAELDIGPPQQRAVLALLLARGDHPTGLSELVDLLWPADPPVSALNIVHRHVGGLRRVLEPGLPPRASGRWLVRQASGYRMAADAEALDLLRFRELARQGREAAANGQARRAVPLFAAALDLCQGPCASDLTAVRGHPLFTAVDQEYLAVARDAADAALAAGLPEQVLPALRQAADRDPLAEPVQARLMLTLAAAGSREEALAVYGAVRTRLAEDLGLDPGAELRAAHDQVLRQEGSAAPGHLDAVPRTPGPAAAPRTTTRAPGPPAVRPAQLPADLAAFAGRRAEAGYVSELLPFQRQAPQGMPIVVIDGMPGAGKSALAVHCAHSVADRFPDGQLFVDLRGFGSREAVSPSEALRGFIAALGVPPERVPTELDGQAALYRSLLAGQRVLVVLDNARDEAQVRPLLPGSPGCAAIVTSRNCLTGLVAGDGARLLTVDVFSPADAREALDVRLGERVAAEPDAAEELVSLSGRLPLALALVAARAAARPRFPLSVIADELRQAQGRLDVFREAGLPDVKAVFSWSYRMLSPGAARLFRLLSLPSGPDISLSAAASLHDAPRRETRAVLAELTWARLLTEHHPGRFSLHDVLRSYATELCAETDAAADRDAALGRVRSYYLHSAHNARVLLQAHEQTPPLNPPEPGARPEQPGDYTAALEWFTAEQRVLEVAVRWAAEHGNPRYAWQLAAELAHFYQRRGLWHDWDAIAQTGMDAARTADDRTGQAYMHRMLAGAAFYLRDSATALAELERAKELYTALGLSSEHAYLHTNFGTVLARIGRFDDAITHHQRALGLYRAAGLRAGEALAKECIGSCANRLGDHCEAIDLLQDALRIYREVGDPGGEASALAGLARSYHLIGDYGEAAILAGQSLELFRCTGSGAHVAKVLTALGDTKRATGDRAGASACFHEALDILAELRLPHADDLRDRLADLGEPADTVSPLRPGPTGQ